MTGLKRVADMQDEYPLAMSEERVRELHGLLRRVPAKCLNMDGISLGGIPKGLGIRVAIKTVGNNNRVYRLCIPHGEPIYGSGGRRITVFTNNDPELPMMTWTAVTLLGSVEPQTRASRRMNSVQDKKSQDAQRKSVELELARLQVRERSLDVRKKENDLYGHAMLFVPGLAAASESVVRCEADLRTGITWWDMVLHGARLRMRYENARQGILKEILTPVISSYSVRFEALPGWQASAIPHYSTVAE